jgi:hypothetical protein
MEFVVKEEDKISETFKEAMKLELVEFILFF